MNFTCIKYEQEQLNNGDIQNNISFYEKYPVCDGDIDITKNEIYEIKNPSFLSDTFVFCKKHYDNVFLVGEVNSVCYIKINHQNQIDEIGSNFESRFHCKYEELLKNKNVKKASNLHTIMFSLIGDEYWCSTYKKE